MPAAEVHPGRRQMLRRDELWMTLLLAVAVAASIAGIHVLLQGAAWFWPALAIALLALVLPALARALAAPRWLPPLVSAAGVSAVLTVFFAPLSGYLLVIPSAETWAEFGQLLDLAGRSIEEQAVPADPIQPIVFVLCLGAAAAAIVADLFAVAVRAPALAGLPLAVLLAVPGVIVAGLSDPLPFVVVAVCYLGMLRVGAPPGQGRLALAIGAVSLVVAVALPGVLPRIAPEASGGGGSGIATGINPVLSLGRDLRQSRELTVLEYSTESEAAQYLRLTTIDDFQGADWTPSRTWADRRNTLDSIPRPPGLSGDVATREESSDIRIVSLDSPWLPMPYPPVAISGVDRGSWRWSANDLSVSRFSRGATADEYTVRSLIPDPSAEQLTQADSSAPSSVISFLEVPDGLDPSVAATAQSVVGGAQSDYEKAVELQDFFRYGDFSYSETAPVDEGYDGTGVGVVSAFLEERSGYCIHFASAMAVMARTVGIPSRIAVGFLPGTRVAGQEPVAFEVTNRDLHAWPELYFDGLGWLRFEPTVSRGELPGYADPSAVDAPSLPDQDDPTTAATTAPSSEPTTAPSTTPGGEGTDAATGTGTSAAWLWSALVLLLLLIGVATPALLRRGQRLRRRSRLRRGLAPPTLAWQELMQSAGDLGSPVPRTLTAAEAAVFLLPEGPGDAIERIVAAVERESYSREGLTADPSIVDDLDGVLAVLRAAASRGARLRAALLPPSIWGRIVGRLGGAI